MNPAFSVILFTTLSGAGYGLLAWLGLEIAIAPPGLFPPNNTGFSTLLCTRLIMLFATGMGFTAIGLVSSTFHLGKPLRAWRAFSQWRTSWLSREGVLALMTYLPAIALIVLLSAPFVGVFFAKSVTIWLVPSLAGALATLSLLTVVCTAMIYASLKPVPAWRHRLVVPVYVFFALLTGRVLLSALQTLTSSVPVSIRIVVLPVNMTVIPVGLVVALAVMKLIYWRDIDRIELPSREAATALEGIGKVAVFERPHTEANYLTREMGFVLARKHSRKLRIIAVALFAGIPLLALLAAVLAPATAAVDLWIATLAAIAGAFVERWLFFAEAKHMVMLYY